MANEPNRFERFINQASSFAGGHDYVQNPPHYKKLHYFEWVDDYLALQEIKREIKFLESKRSEVWNTQSPKEIVKSRFKESFQKYRQRRLEKLAGMLEPLKMVREPFSDLEHRLTGSPSFQRLGVSLTWSEIEQAIKLMEFSDDTLTEDEKESRLADLGKAIKDLNAKMQEHSPPGYFLIGGLPGPFSTL